MFLIDGFPKKYLLTQCLLQKHFWHASQELIRKYEFVGITIELRNQISFHIKVSKHHNRFGQAFILTIYGAFFDRNEINLSFESERTDHSLLHIIRNQIISMIFCFCAHL